MNHIMVSELTDLGVFPGSDHTALTWKLEVKTAVESIDRKLLSTISRTVR